MTIAPTWDFTVIQPLKTVGRRRQQQDSRSALVTVNQRIDQLSLNEMPLLC